MTSCWKQNEANRLTSLATKVLSISRSWRCSSVGLNREAKDPLEAWRWSSFPSKGIRRAAVSMAVVYFEKQGYDTSVAQWEFLSLECHPSSVDVIINFKLMTLILYTVWYFWYYYIWYAYIQYIGINVSEFIRICVGKQYCTPFISWRYYAGPVPGHHHASGRSITRYLL